MNDILMQLGNFQFRVPVSAYQKIDRKSKYIWSSINRIENTPDRQFTGQASDQVTLSGTLYPQMGGAGTMGALRLMASEGVPYLLVDGLGNVHGHWCIENINESTNTFVRKGRSRRIDFTVQLSFYGWEAE